MYTDEELEEKRLTYLRLCKPKELGRLRKEGALAGHLERSARRCRDRVASLTQKALQGELSAQKAELEKAQRSKGNTGGLPKMVRVNLAERAVGKVERKLRAEEKRLAACVVSTGVKATATARIPAVPKATRPKGRTRKPHPMVELRRAVQSAQRRGR